MQQIENKFIDVKHSELLKEFITFYLSQYGEVKVNEISKKIHTSKTVQKFLLEAKRIRQPLGTDDYLAAVHAILYFSFAKAETISLATIILLCKWENEVGTPLDIASNRYLNTMFFRILDKCDKYKVNLSDNQTFFGQFYKHLENSQQNTSAFNISEENKENPFMWILAAKNAVAIYDGNLDPTTFGFSDFSFSTFMINCGLIYLLKFPDQVHQIGWDYSFDVKNLFIELVLQQALEYNEFGVKSNENAEYFGENDRVENCLKFIAQNIYSFQEYQDKKYLKILAYNAYDEPMVIDFVHKECEDEDQPTFLFIQLGEVLQVIKNLT